MEKEELKNKIVEIIINAIWKDAEADYDSTDETEAGSIADALIAAGLKFDTVVSHTATFDLMQQEQINRLEIRVAKSEHRAEVAERALNKFAENVTCEDCPFFSDCSSSEKMKNSEFEKNKRAS